MRTFVVWFLIGIGGLTFVPSVKAEDRWSGGDKAAHAAVSFAVSTVAYNFYRNHTGLSDQSSRLAAFATTMAIGLAKELIDDEVSEKDLVYDAAGAGTAALIGIKIDF